MNTEEITLCQMLTQTLGYSTFTKIGESCRGKWRGTTDYSLIFDGKHEFFISNGMKYFAEKLKEYILQFQTFEKYKKDMFQIICDQVVKDNQTAVQEGLLPVKCVSLDLIRTTSSCFLWPYIRMEVAGIQFDFIETGIKIAIFNNELVKHFEEVNTRQIYTAGSEDSPTFIFGNVRHSHLMQIQWNKRRMQNQ